MSTFFGILCFTWVCLKLEPSQIGNGAINNSLAINGILVSDNYNIHVNESIRTTKTTQQTTSPISTIVVKYGHIRHQKTPTIRCKNPYNQACSNPLKQLSIQLSVPGLLKYSSPWADWPDENTPEKINEKLKQDKLWNLWDVFDRQFFGSPRYFSMFPKTNSSQPENGWLGDDPLILGFGLFLGPMFEGGYI